MLDNLAILHPENIDDGVAVLSKKARVAAVKQDVVSVCEDTLNLAACIGIVFGNPLDVVSKAIEAVCGERRVLLVGLAAIEADRCIDIPLKQGFLIKTDNGL